MRLVIDPSKGFAVGIAEHRAKRPVIKGKAKCPFCPGSEHLTPPTTFALPEKKWLVRSFRNSFPILSPADRGDHEIIVETNDHDQAFEDIPHRKQLFEVYQNRFNALHGKEVFLCKNSGEGSGASICHEHAQIIAFPFVPEFIAREKSMKKCVLCTLLNEKPLFENSFFKAVVPDFGRFAFETWVIAKNHSAAFGELSVEEGVFMIEALQETVRRVKKKSSAYNIAFHVKPHLHAEVYPRKSVYGGVELGAGFYVNAAGGNKALKELLDEKC